MLCNDFHNSAPVWAYDQKQPVVQRGQDNVCEHNTAVGTNGTRARRVDMGNEQRHVHCADKPDRDLAQSCRVETRPSSENILRHVVCFCLKRNPDPIVWVDSYRSFEIYG